MANKERHIVQYKKNKTLANSKYIKQSQFKDWRITMIFYATMHCLESKYADIYHPSTHKDRKKFLGKTSPYINIIDDYENLEMLSRKARYDCVDMLDKEVTDALINMKTIEDFVSDNTY